MSDTNIWEKYIQKGNIGKGKIIKAQNKKIGNYVAIKKIDKQRIKNFPKLLKEIEKRNKIISENYIKIKETFESDDFFYLVMDLCVSNLEECIQMREKALSINEVRSILIQLNNVFKIWMKENIIHSNLKPSNILISYEKIDKCLIKLLDYGTNEFIDHSNTETLNDIPLTMAPEIFKDKLKTNKCDLWSLGIIIYYLLFKEYPYNGINEYILYQDIISGKDLKKCENKELNDLMNRMLKIDIKERISWEEYFNHPFFKQNVFELNLPQIKFICEIHSQNINIYCKTCKLNICNHCLSEHNKHEIIPFSKIGLTNEEIIQIENINKEIKENLNKLNRMKSNITFLLNQMKLIKENNSIYDNDLLNNYKIYYLDYLKLMNEQIKIEENIKLIDLNNIEEEITNENFIIGEYYIKEENLKDEVQILNCFEQSKNKESWLTGINNEKELRESSEIFINDEKINFCFKYKFSKEGKYKIKFRFKRFILVTNYLFYNCSSLISLDLSNFLSNKVTNMNNMFSNCISLSSIHFSDFNTDNVTDMNSMFSNCHSLTSLDLSNFNTKNTIDMGWMFSGCFSLNDLKISNFNTDNLKYMSYMFSGCSSLKYLDLSNFNTINVQNMNHMFSDCTSLSSINLTNFKTNEVINMEQMFENCSSLQSIDLTSFNTNNVINMNGMFKSCSSLNSLDLSNFNTNNVKLMIAMFQLCISLKSLDLSNFKTNNVTNMSYMFNYCKSLKNINVSSFNTENVTDMNEMFFNCSSLNSLDLSNFNTKKVTDMNEMFSNCYSLTSLNLLNFIINNSNNINNMFLNLNKNCKVIINDMNSLNTLKTLIDFK